MICLKCYPDGKPDRYAAVESWLEPRDRKKYARCLLCRNEWQVAEEIKLDAVVASLSVGITIRDGMLFVAFNQPITALQFDSCNQSILAKPQ